MNETAPDDAFADAVEWNVAAAAEYLGDRGEQIIDWAWKQGRSLYGVRPGGSEPVEIVFREEHGRIDFATLCVMSGMLVTHQRVTIPWDTVKGLAQLDVDLLLALPSLPDESVKVDLTAAASLDMLKADLAAADARANEESAKTAQAIAAFEQLAHRLDDGKQEKDDLLTERELEAVREATEATVLALERAAKMQAENEYAAGRDDRMFRDLMEQFGSKKQARSKLYDHLKKIGCSEKTAGNRASGAKYRFEQSSRNFPEFRENTGKSKA